MREKNHKSWKCAHLYIYNIYIQPLCTPPTRNMVAHTRSIMKIAKMRGRKRKKGRNRNEYPFIELANTNTLTHHIYRHYVIIYKNWPMILCKNVNVVCEWKCIMCICVCCALHTHMDSYSFVCQTILPFYKNMERKYSCSWIKIESQTELGKVLCSAKNARFMYVAKFNFLENTWYVRMI